MIADLHCHFPMHLVYAEREPHGRLVGWLEKVRDELEAGAFDVAARVINNPGWGDGWRVSFEGLEAGGVGLVCSVLYWPFGEFLPEHAHHARPGEGTFDELVAQLDDVEAKLLEQDPDRERHVIVRSAEDLDPSRMQFLHCIEGGFHLGPEAGGVETQIAELARRGVLYVTLAHLFFRGVAANAPAIPLLTDGEYDFVFPQATDGLTPLGLAAVEAMWNHKVMVDLSHMRQDAMDMALERLGALDPGRTLPVIASHVGVRSEGPDDHAYNLTPETMRAIKGRGGVIGLIAAQHLLGETHSPEESRDLLRRHIDAIHATLETHAHTAIGTDLDGFIKPTLTGIDRADQLTLLEEWVRDLYPDDAEAILHGNAERVIRSVLDLRGGS